MTDQSNISDVPNHNSIAYSVIINNKMKEVQDNKVAPLRCTLPRRNYTWVDDDTVTSCYSCNKDFSVFLRKHHCRMCGKIFCYECSSYQQIVPDNLASDKSVKKPLISESDAKITFKFKKNWSGYLSNFIKDTDPTIIELKNPSKQRVCATCNTLINTINSVQRITDVFTTLNLDVRQLKKLGSVCKMWNTASNYCLTIFREIQYKLPTDVLTDTEYNLLWTNSGYLAGHSRYLMALLKSCKTEEEINRAVKLLDHSRTVSCRSLMCTRSCCSKLLSTDAINLLAYCFRTLKFTDVYKKIALQYLVCSDQEFKCYISFLVYNLRYDNGVLADWIIRRCINNFELLTQVYWEINLYLQQENDRPLYKIAKDKLKNILSLDQHKPKQIQLKQQKEFFGIIEQLADNIFTDKKRYTEVKDKYNLESTYSTAIWPNSKIKKLLLNKIQIKDSISKPMIIPCITTDNQELKLMYKKDNLRKDQVIMSIINLMSIIVKKEENLDLHIVDYNILPTTPDKGFVEIVDESETLYYIQHKIKSSILNYILESNPDTKISEIKERFVRSTAAYSVLTYLLGVGDRHMENIMVTKDGRLFHIDFGFILGKDPAFNNPSIRITPEIIDAVGGFSSEYYVYFKEVCTKIFNCMRRNIDIFMNLILILKKISHTSIDVSEEEIKNQLVKRFIPGENELDAQLHLVKKLENTSSYTNKIKDWCHYHSREKTISGAFSRLSNAVSGLWGPTLDD